MAAIPEPIHSVAASVFEMWRKRGASEPARMYLGASSIGGPCERALWYSFRHASQPTFDGRMYRLFNRGHREEAVIFDELRAIGCDVRDHDENGRQWGFSDIGGHFRGHMDAAATGTPYAPKTWCVLECKTHNAKSFKDLCDKGLQTSKPQHYDQMAVYMGQFGMDRGLYYAVNKDTDAVYTEWVKFDKDRYETLMARARRVIESPVPPLRCSNDSSNYICKGCQSHAICHGTEAPAIGCRTCAHATPFLDGADGHWYCEHPDVNYGVARIDDERQRMGCEMHRYIPDLLERWAEYLGSDDGVDTCYRNKLTGNEFTNGCYTSGEILAANDKRAIGDPAINELREGFGAKVAA